MRIDESSTPLRSLSLVPFKTRRQGVIKGRSVSFSLTRLPTAVAQHQIVSGGIPGARSEAASGAGSVAFGAQERGVHVHLSSRHGAVVDELRLWRSAHSALVVAPTGGAQAGDDDDVVARQLREAATREPDPAVREKLWDEYRKLKGLPEA